MYKRPELPDEVRNNHNTAGYTRFGKTTSAQDPGYCHYVRLNDPRDKVYKDHPWDNEFYGEWVDVTADDVRKELLAQIEKQKEQLDKLIKESKNEQAE